MPRLEIELTEPEIAQIGILLTTGMLDIIAEELYDPKPFGIAALKMHNALCDLFPEDEVTRAIRRVMEKTGNGA